MTPYHKEYTKYTGSIIGALVLAQIIYWYDKMGKSFFKRLRVTKVVRGGNKKILSFSEELGISYDQLHKALKVFATKVKRGERYDLRECGLVLYWNAGYGQTYFILNYPKLFLLEDIHPILFKRISGFKNWTFQFRKLNDPTFEIAFDHLEHWEFLLFYNKDNTNKIKNDNTKEQDFSLGIINSGKIDDLKLQKSCAKKVEIIYPFDTPDFIATWDAWKLHRREKHNHFLSEIEEQAGLKLLSSYTEEFSIQLLLDAIAGGWRQFHFSNTPKKFTEFKNNEYESTNKNSESNASFVADFLSPN